MYIVYRLTNTIACSTLILLIETDIKSYIVILCPNGNICFVYDDQKLEKCPSGYEDPRSFILSDKLYIVVNRRNSDCYTQMYLLKFLDMDFKNKNVCKNFNKILLNTEFQQTKKEKNWMPFVHENELYFIYNPHIILKYNKHKCIKIYEDKNMPNRVKEYTRWK